MEQEEESRNTEEKMDKERTGVGKFESNTNEDVDKTLLAPAPGEEDKEDVEETVTDELLKDESETMQQEEVIRKMIDEEVMMTREEQRGGVQVTTFLQVKDPSDPLNINQS